MDNTFKYKGYEGSAKVCVDSFVLHGKVVHVDDLVAYESTTITGLKREFEAAVDDYIETLQELETAELKFGINCIEVSPWSSKLPSDFNTEVLKLFIPRCELSLTGVKILHLTTGVTVTCDHHKNVPANRKNALQELQREVDKHYRRKLRELNIL